MSNFENSQLESAKQKYFGLVKKLKNLKRDVRIGRCLNCGIKPTTCLTEDGMGQPRYCCEKRDWENFNYKDIKDSEFLSYMTEKERLSEEIYRLSLEYKKYFCLNCGQTKPIKKDPAYYVYQWPNSFHMNANEEYTCTRI